MLASGKLVRMTTHAFFLFLLSSCGNNTEKIPLRDVQTDCVPGQVILSVYDGFYQNLCGCAESARQNILPPASLDCTISVGANVFFTYLSPSMPAQIFSVGTPSFVSSRPYNPEEKAITRSYSITFSAPGIYQFHNSYNQSMVGRFIVQ